MKPFPGQLAGRPAVPRVVRIDLFDRGNNLVQGREAIKALARRQHVAEAGLLGDDRPAAKYWALRSLNQPLRGWTFWSLATVNSAREH